MTTNILFAGVGGLGATLTSVIVARAAHFDSYNLCGTQVHGLAQRGGSVPVQVRFGKEKIYSPTIRNKEADLILGFELTEALKYIDLADKERTNFIIDTFEVRPTTIKPTEHYPTLEEVKENIKKISKRFIFIDASDICKEQFGDAILGKMMILGIALKEGMLPLTKESLIRAIKETVPRNIENNLKALDLGLNYNTNSE